MNKLTIIGNLTKDPELRSVPDGHQVCTFDVAVNRRKGRNGEQTADYFHVNAWNDLGVSCSKYLAKGKKAAVVGPVSLRTYETKDGRHGASIEVLAHDVEFLTPRESAPVVQQAAVDAQTGYQRVDEDCPF